MYLVLKPSSVEKCVVKTGYSIFTNKSIDLLDKLCILYQSEGKNFVFPYCTVYTQWGKYGTILISNFFDKNSVKTTFQPKRPMNCMHLKLIWRKMPVSGSWSELFNEPIVEKKGKFTLTEEIFREINSLFCNLFSI